jgi:hypothetical protein
LHQIRQFWLAQSVEIYSGLIKSALVPTKNYARRALEYAGGYETARLLIACRETDFARNSWQS